MRITIELTKIEAQCGEGRGSLWQGTTEGGCPVEALLIALAPRPNSVAELNTFDQEFRHQRDATRLPQIKEMITEVIDPVQLLRIAMRIIAGSGKITPATMAEAVEEVRAHIEARWVLSATEPGGRG